MLVIKGPFFIAYQNLPESDCGCLVVIVWYTESFWMTTSVGYTSHVTTMFAYQTPNRHALLAHEKRHLNFSSFGD